MKRSNNQGFLIRYQYPQRLSKWRETFASQFKPIKPAQDPLEPFMTVTDDVLTVRDARHGLRFAYLLRMPKISICSSRYILLVANELADQLEFSDKLGITRSVAEVYDAAGNLHTNFTALSFHKVFFHQRFETRFKNIPKESRLLVRVELDASSSTFLIHQSLLENWQKCGIEEVNYDIKDEHLSLNKLMTLNYYWPHRTCSFANMDDFQQNINGMIDSY
ncbi:hypothetical protein [Vibrio campbellii]|uniref:hypothetical protein n=1 Tax=Vibrio campbellii TaxID=680 RepID=UPI00210A51FF|nr:hypothetical protein [Vibrio campbellii]UTZ41425.1 hypothetical protein HB764_08455 [Vibrio campbellii]